MEKRKVHISPWLVLQLAALLILGALLTSAGIAYARYRADSQWEYQFQVAANGTVVLGSVDAQSGEFVPEQSAWQQSNGGMKLEFAIGNGTSEIDHAQMDQVVRLRILGSPGTWSENQQSPVTLQVGDAVYTASVTRIREGSALYKSFGDGWVFRFLDDTGNELTWDFPGDGFTYREMSLTVENITDVGLLQLQLLGENKQ